MAPLKSSLARTVGKLLGVSKDTDLSLRGRKQSNRVPPKPPFIASGGNVDALEPGNGYVYHTFTGSGTFTVTSGSRSIEILLVGGGGSGGPSDDSSAGGGGAGGLIYWSSMPLSTGSYTVTIGSGGASGTNNGAPSVFGPGTPLHLVALGGGYGGGGPRGSQYSGSPGGSGGGGGGWPGYPPAGSGTQTTNPTIPTNSRTYGFGYNGGGLGGGGAGEAGGTDATDAGGDGRQYPAFTGPLIGVPTLNPLSGYFAGGGSGPGPALRAGDGGGGNGGNSAPGTSGFANSGGGGGGSYQPNSGFQSGGAGGSGICVIRYLA